MTGRIAMTQGTTGPATSSTDNQPMDLAQKSQTTRIADAVTNVVKGGATLVQFGSNQLIAASSAPTHVTCKSGLRNDSTISGAGGVTLFPRQPSQGALNLVAPNSGTTLSSFTSNVTVAARPVSHPSSASVTIATTSSLPTSGYHIPRGAAAVANMSASRSQTLSSIVRTSSQLGGTPNSATITSPRANIISQRMVPISNSSWISRSTSTTAVLSTKASTQGTGRATITSGRSSQSPVMPITTYHGGTVKPGAIVTGTIRSQGPSAVRVGAAGEGPRAAHMAKGIHITHPVSHGQKYIGTNAAGSVRAVGTSTFITPGNVVGTSIAGNTIYTPTSTLVTSLASSGTTITPHPVNRSQPPNTVRLTSAVTSVYSQSSTQSNVASLGGICLTPSTSATLLTHPNALPRGHSMEQVPLKTPVVRASHPATSQPHGLKVNASGIPSATHISFSGSKVIAQPSQGAPLALAHLSNVTGPKSPGTVLSSQAPVNAAPFHTRSGGGVAPAIGRGGGATISMTKVIPQVKGTANHGVATSIPTITATPAHVTHSAGSSGGLDPQPPHPSVFLHRSSLPAAAVTVAAGVTVSQPERTVATVTQYSIATPYYFESTNQSSFPVNTSIMPTNHYIPSTAGSGALRVGASGGVTNSVGTNTADASGHQSIPLIKPNASPRPSILRKRPEIESGSPLKAAKNLSAALNIPMTSPPSPARPDSRGNGNISSGSTTLSANSSPGNQINEEETTVSNLKAATGIKQETSAEEGTPPGPCVISFPMAPGSSNASVATLIETPVVSTGSIVEKGTTCLPNLSPYTLSIPQVIEGVSPRKKPRKQQLMGNELHEARSVEEDFENPALKKIKKEPACPKPAPPPESDEEEKEASWPEAVPTKTESWPEAPTSPEPVVKRPHMSLINSYRQTWKARHNHFFRHSDVRPKEEKKRTVNEIANQKLAMQRVNGWKVMHLSGQVEDLVEMESDVISRLQVLLNAIEKRQQLRKSYKDFDKDVNRLSELVKANIQRSVIIKDQMSEAKTQMSKIFNHKDNIVSILTKYGNKRTLRKKEKL